MVPYLGLAFKENTVVIKTYLGRSRLTAGTGKKLTMQKMELSVLPGMYSIHQLSSDANLPEEIFSAPFSSVTRTAEEISVVVPSTIPVPIMSHKVECGWRILKINAVLDFSLLGILAKISLVLANAKISIFVLSTYNTDYIFIKDESLD